LNNTRVGFTDSGVSSLSFHQNCSTRAVAQNSKDKRCYHILESRYVAGQRSCDCQRVNSQRVPDYWRPAAPRTTRTVSNGQKDPSSLLGNCVAYHPSDKTPCGTTNLGGKCKFAASAPRLCQFPNSGHPSVGHCTLDAAAPHDGTEPL
jgi:hypothetical protein